MKKLFALMLVVTAMVVIGCAKSEDATTTPAETTPETTTTDMPADPAAPPAETPAETK